jgi:hypothetical protein
LLRIRYGTSIARRRFSEPPLPHFGPSEATILDTNFTNPHESNRSGQSSASAFARLRRDLPSSDFDMASKRALDRGSSTSFRFWARYFLHKGFEARIAAKIVEKWIYFDERNVESGVVVAMLQFIDGVCLIA